MNTDLSRPTFTRTVRRITQTSIIISMALVWLLLSAVGVLAFTLLPDAFSPAVQDHLPRAIVLTLGVVTGCMVFACALALVIDRYRHNDVTAALHDLALAIHDVRILRHFSRRMAATPVKAFHPLIRDLNGLLDEVEEWQLSLQAKNARLMRTALHDPLTGLPNRAAFRHAVSRVMQDNVARRSSALLFIDGDNFRAINEAWGHAAGDSVLIEVAKRLTVTGGKPEMIFRLSGDQFVLILSEINTEHDVQRLATTLSGRLLRPFGLPDGSTAAITFRISYALTCEHETSETLLELAGKNRHALWQRHSNAP